MNHSKKIIILFAVSLIILATSVAYAQTLGGNSTSVLGNATSVQNNSSITQNTTINSLQTSNFSSTNQTAISNQTANQISSSSFVIPYHPRDPVSYYAEKQRLDNDTRVWLKTNQSKIIPDPSGVNIYLGLNNPLDAASSGLFDPPDVQVAVGPNHVFEMVNLYGEIWNKNTQTSIQNVTLSSFFGFPSSDHISDPKILYDNQTGRWFATIEDFTTNTVSIKVSQTNDPTGTWNSPIYDSAYYYCPDQPKVGLSNDKFVISVNDFPCSGGSSLGAEYHVFDKTNLINGIKSMWKSGLVVSDFGVTPVQSQSSTSTLYMISDGGVSSTNQVRLYTLTGTVPNILNNTSNLIVRTIGTAPSAVQPITTTLLDTGDTRVLDAAWYKGKLWFSLDDGCTPTGDSIKRSCVRLIQINTNTTTVTQDFDINAVGTYYYYPALRLDGFGGMGTIFGTSSSATYPSLMVTGQGASDPINSFKQLSYLIQGSRYEENDIFNTGITRYGDYFGAGLDPSDSSRIWIGGEYNWKSPGHPAASWSTFIASISFDCMPLSSGDWVISTSCTLASSATPPANVIVQNNAVLTIPSGVNLNLDFTRYHLLVYSGSGVLIQPGGKIL